MLRLVLGSVMVAVLAACGGENEPAKKAPSPAGGAPTSAPAAPAATAVTPEAVLEAASKAFAEARAANDAPKLLEMTKAMMPTTEEMRKVLRAGSETDAFLEQYKAERIRGDANEAAREILKPKQPTQTVVKVHSATTEELAAYVNGSVAAAEFPGGMKRFAEKVAAPGRVWHTIEYLEPGQDAGMKFTAFTVVDGRVFFVVKPWRAIPEPK